MATWSSFPRTSAPLSPLQQTVWSITANFVQRSSASSPHLERISAHRSEVSEDFHNMGRPVDRSKAVGLSSGSGWTGKPHGNYRVLVPITKFALFLKLPLELHRPICKILTTVLEILSYSRALETCLSIRNILSKADSLLSAGNFALFTPKVFIIDFVKVGPCHELTTLDRQSSIMQVNKEARAEALRIEILTYDQDINSGVSGT